MPTTMPSDPRRRISTTFATRPNGVKARVPDGLHRSFPGRASRNVFERAGKLQGRAGRRIVGRGKGVSGLSKPSQRAGIVKQIGLSPDRVIHSLRRCAIPSAASTARRRWSRLTGDDVCPVSPLAAAGRRSAVRARDRSLPRDRAVVVEPLRSDVRRGGPQATRSEPGVFPLALASGRGVCPDQWRDALSMAGR